MADMRCYPPPCGPEAWSGTSILQRARGYHCLVGPLVDLFLHSKWTKCDILFKNKLSLPSHTQIHEMIIHQTLIGEMILAALSLPNVPPPACWACWSQPVASWPSGFTDPGCEAECWSLTLAWNRHSSGCLAKASLALGPLGTVLLWVGRLLCGWQLLVPGVSLYGPALGPLRCHCLGQ